ncbi:30S ribosomal protein S8 [Candidatus Falkowbacteria bacterium]|nr:30S ribosomal protein S8 [Candidatus Falkowbacteria bacterium]
MIIDPIADMLTRIRNASAVRKQDVLVPFSKMKFTIAQILEKEGYVSTVVKEDGRNFRIKLMYDKNRRPAIMSIKRISKPGRRLYVTAGKMPRVLGGYGVAIVSTSRGVITSKEAKKLNVGGELVCEIY